MRTAQQGPNIRMNKTTTEGRSRFSSVYLLATAFALLVTPLELLAAKTAAKPRAPFCKYVFSDESAIYKTLKSGSDTYQTADSIAKNLQKVSAKKRSETIEEIFVRYRKLPKKNVIPTQIARVGGRRLADRVLTLTLRYDLEFATRVSSGSSPKEAFKAIVNDQIAKVGGGYSADLIADIIEMLRTDLPKKQAELNGYPLKFFVGGSFVNGKADLADSDLDLSINNASLVRANDEWEAKVAEILRKGVSTPRPASNLKIELHGEPASFYGALNPFVFEITQAGVKLHVYGPASPGETRSDLEARSVEIYPWD
ncbi:MAG: hypothetical protein EOP05_03305 [Proteobacteria bacterium]|nr:MAG: hypothetical protein EOP05_03305 [Pseudomonadota bacterium]